MSVNIVHLTHTLFCYGAFPGMEGQCVFYKSELCVVSILDYLTQINLSSPCYIVTHIITVLWCLARDGEPVCVVSNLHRFVKYVLYMCCICVSTRDYLTQTYCYINLSCLCYIVHSTHCYGVTVPWQRCRPTGQYVMYQFSTI